MDADKLRKDIAEILQGADLSQLSARKVRLQLEGKYDTSLTHRKAEIDELVMEELNKVEEKKEKVKSELNGNAKKRKRGSEEEEEEDESEEEDDDEEDNEKDEGKEPKKTENDEDIARQLQEEEEDGCVRRTRHSNKKRVVNKSEKKEKKQRKKGVPRENSFTETCNLSPELSAVVGEEKMKRSEVVKKMWAIVKEKNLFDPKNKRYMLCDEQMLKLFGKKRILLFGMMKHLTSHIYKNDEVISTS